VRISASLFVAVACTGLASTANAQTSAIVDKTVIIANKYVTDYCYISPGGRIFMSEASKLHSDSGFGNEFEIGKTDHYHRKYDLVGGGTMNCAETTRAELSGQTLTLQRLSSICAGKDNHSTFLITIEFNGDACTAIEPDWGPLTCKVVPGRQLP
jgi:hypothetical protein